MAGNNEEPTNAVETPMNNPSKRMNGEGEGY